MKPRSVRPRVLVLGAAAPHVDWVAELLAANSFSVELRTAWEHPLLIGSGRPPTIALLNVDTRSVGRIADLLRSIDVALQPHTLAVCTEMRMSAVETLVEAGIGDFVSLPGARAELLPRVAQRLRAIDRPTVRPTGERSQRWPALDPFTGTLATKKRSVRLTEREYRLFEVLRSSFGSVVHRRVLLTEIWGQHAPDSNILEVYVRYLRVKLGRVAPDLTIETVRGVGYSLHEARPELP